MLHVLMVTKQHSLQVFLVLLCRAGKYKKHHVARVGPVSWPHDKMRYFRIANGDQIGQG